MNSIPEHGPANFPIESNTNPNEIQNVENKQEKKKSGFKKKLKPDPNTEGLGVVLIKEGVKHVSKIWKGTSKVPEKINSEKINNAALDNTALDAVNNEDKQIHLNMMDEFIAQELQLQNDQKIHSLNLQALGDVSKTLPQVKNALDIGFLLKSSSETETPKTVTPKTATPKITGSDTPKTTPKKTEEKK